MHTHRVTAAHLAAIRAHAEAAYPLECCGIVFDAGVHRATNAARSRTRFRLGDADQLLLARSFDTDDPARALYHSHVDTAPDRPPYFSAADVAGATYAGRPLYPGLLHLVVNVRSGRAAEASLFALDEDRPREVESWPVPA